MSEVSALTKQRDDAKTFVARRNMALKLAENKEFKTLILKEFCVDECARHAQNSGDPSLSHDARADSLALAQAAGHLRRWLQVVVRMGDQAEGQLQNLEEAIEEARREDLEG